MPTKVYGPTIVSESETANLRVYNSLNCTASGSNSVTQSVSYVKSYRIDQANGRTIPGWRKIANSGRLIPMTNWHRYHFEFEASLAHREWCSSPTQKRNVWENMYRGYSSSYATEAYLMSLITLPDLEYYVQKAAAGIYSSGWDALTFLAEISQLRRMLFGVVRKLDSLTRGKSPGKLQDLWLEGRYGWRVLMYDIQDLAEAISEVNENRTRYRKNSGGITTELVHQESTSTSNGITELVERDYTFTISARGVVIADIDIPAFQFNPLTTAWEVTRLSFVVDWLFNVGQALDAASFLLMVKDYKACTGYRIDVDMVGSASLVGTTGSTVCHANDASWTSKAYIIDRTPASVDVKPRIKLRLDSLKIIDLLALILQRF